MKKVLFIAGLFCYCNIILAQDSNELVNSIMMNARNEVYETIDQRPLFTESNLKTTYTQLQPFLTDSSAMVRRKAFQLLKKVGLGSTDNADRRAVVSVLVDGAGRESGSLRHQILKGLQEFDVEDFENSTIQALVVQMRAKGSSFDLLVMLVGYLNPPEGGEFLREIIAQDTTLNSKERWAVHLALSRMEDTASTQQVLSSARQIQVNDDFIYEMAPDLIYTRQHDPFNLLIDILLDDRSLCYPADPDQREPISCGYRVMELLAPVIVDYPLEVDASGDILTDNYQEALITAREWHVPSGG